MRENADLRLDGTSGRILLQFDDTAFQALRDLRLGAGRISFTLPRSHRRFEGTISDTMLTGTVQDADGNRSTWIAFPMSPQSMRWPVPPRVTFRQLAMGTTAVSERIPGAWLARLPDTAVLEREYTGLARLVGLRPLTGADRMTRWRSLSLGLDEAGREAARAVLARIARGTAADPAFQAIFTQGPGWKLDIHDALPGAARHFLYDFQLSRAASGLRQLGELPDAADSSTIRETGWRLWCRLVTDSAGVLARLDSLARRDPAAAESVQAMLAGFGDAAGWWRNAVRWLLTHPWLDTPAGPRSPAQLMAMFWGVDSLPLPEILDTRFGDVAALPVLGALHIGPYLIQPRNGSAVEWLARGGMQEAFNSWRPIRWGEPPLTVVVGGRAEIVVSPWAQTEARPAAFFGARDAIRIDPGILPIAAVATFLHEWQHLIAAQRRLSGTHPPALFDAGAQLQLREADPWLGEGFAEWATEETLRPAGEGTALLRFAEAEKRLGIAARDPDDPHILGLRLVRAAVAGSLQATARDLLVKNLHDPMALARALHVDGVSRTPGRTLNRPVNAAVIPEVTFTWDEGLAFDISRRLVIVNTRSEH